MTNLPAWRFAWKVAKVLGGAILFRDYVGEFAQCAGESMLPTLRSKGDMLFVEKVSPALKRIRRGDIVVCVSPNDPDKLICKRVIGLERDTIATHYGGLFSSNVVVPPGHVWIEGDNASRSRDSRDFGPIPLGLIRGKALCKVFPLSEFGMTLERR